LGYAALNSSLALYTGHFVGSPPIPITRFAAAAYTILFAGSAMVSARFRNRRLNRLDQIALLASVYSVVWASLFETSMAFVALTVGISSLLIALAYDHIQGGWPSL
jgi:ABC-type microcin C transport system permease subunit YejB